MGRNSFVEDKDLLIDIGKFVRAFGIGLHKSIWTHLDISKSTWYKMMREPDSRIQETIDAALLDVEKNAKSVIIAISQDPKHKKQYDAAKYLADKADRANGIADLLIEEKNPADDMSIEELTQLNSTSNIPAHLVN